MNYDVHDNQYHSNAIQIVEARLSHSADNQKYSDKHALPMNIERNDSNILNYLMQSNCDNENRDDDEMMHGKCLHSLKKISVKYHVS